MKIGLLTYHAVFNFGANLQVHSTYQYLKNAKHDPVVINYIPEDLEAGYKRGHPAEQIGLHEQFLKGNMVISEKCRNSEDVARIIKKEGIETVIIGSDAVLQHKGLWSRMYLTRKGLKFRPRRSNLVFPNPYWGCFIPYLHKKIPVSVLSASSQNTNYRIIPPVKKRAMRRALERFQWITVRDQWTRRMVSHLTSGKRVPEVTPDPVFAYNQNITYQPGEQETKKKFDLPEKYVLFSFKHGDKVDYNWLDKCKVILMNKGFVPICLTMPWGIPFREVPFRVIETPLDPIDWYALIRYSSGYIGENMHPIIICLHNVVPFFAFDSYGIIRLKYFLNEESSKTYHILNEAGFKENRISISARSYRIPAPENVLNHIFSFDKEKCKRFSDRQLSTYNEMMQKILQF